jgi:hypothetical protein
LCRYTTVASILTALVVVPLQLANLAGLALLTHVILQRKHVVSTSEEGWHFSLTSFCSQNAN